MDDRIAYWIEQIDETHYCSNCGYDALWEMAEITAFHEYLSPYCPHCGKLMTKIIYYGEEVLNN